MFGMSPLAQIGLAPTWFLAKKLMEVCGPVGTREILLLGDPMSARWMYDRLDRQGCAERRTRG